MSRRLAPPLAVRGPRRLNPGVLVRTEAECGWVAVKAIRIQQFQISLAARRIGKINTDRGFDEVDCARARKAKDEASPARFSRAVIDVATHRPERQCRRDDIELFAGAVDDPVIQRVAVILGRPDAVDDIGRCPRDEAMPPVSSNRELTMLTSLPPCPSQEMAPASLHERIRVLNREVPPAAGANASIAPLTGHPLARARRSRCVPYCPIRGKIRPWAGGDCRLFAIGV